MRSDARPFVEVVAALGHRIADSAIWFDGRCNWTGASLRRGELRSRRSPEREALGPDLYGGTSGVALFLAEAATKLDDRRLSKTAFGAIRHALDHADDIGPGLRDGLYAGHVGIVYSAARVAEVLGAEEVGARARRLLRAWHRDSKRATASDVMNGCSGAVVGLVALSELIDEPWLMESVAVLGEELAARAEITRDGWSWPAPGASAMHNLCGYAHGAAGIGHAFIELFDLMGDDRFREAGERAFDYERSWIDGRSGTWPDLRGVARRAGRDAPLLSANSWCNGAAGIAVSRLRAADVVGSAALRRDADLGLESCKRHAWELLEREPDDFSLCHGAAGTGDVLLAAANSPDHPRAVLAAEVGHWGLACGLPEGEMPGESPGLLLGLAGIGMFYLRLSDPRVRSPLLVHREHLDSAAGDSLQSQVPEEGESRGRLRP
jgi:lantibiotic modifying enzyme